MLLSFGHFVVAVLLQAGVHLRAREPCFWIDMERCERVGDRNGGDVLGLSGDWRCGRVVRKRHHSFSRDMFALSVAR
jgi:hypothetical protein